MFVETVEILRARGNDITTVIPQDGPLRRVLTDLGIACEVIPFPVLRKTTLTAARAPRFAFEMMQSAYRAWRLIQDYSPSVLYVSTVIAPQWLVAAWQAGVPSVCHVHELPDNLPRIAAKILYAPLRLASLTIANSEASRDFIVKVQPVVDARAITILNGLQLPPFYEPRRDSVEKRVLVVGRLGRHKGQDVAIEAFAKVLDRGWSAVLEIAGSAYPGYEWFENGLRQRVAELGISDRVRFVGFRSNVWSLYEQADVVLVPSRTEPFGLVAVEAMAAGRPVVASAVGGLAAIVREGVTGWSVPPDDPGRLATTLESIFLDPDGAGELARKASVVAHDQYSRARFAGALMTALDERGLLRGA